MKPSIGAVGARKPVQARSQERINAVLEAAESLVAEVGPEATSIPEIARVSGVLRASIYQFFPDKYVLFAAIAERYLARVAAAVAITGTRHPRVEFPALIKILVNAACDFYDATPAAGALVLGGPFSHAAYLAQATTISDIGREVRALLAKRPTPVVLPAEPDVATIAVEIAFACMKHGYFREGKLSTVTRREATKATTAYVASWT